MHKHDPKATQPATSPPSTLALKMIRAPQASASSLNACITLHPMHHAKHWPQIMYPLAGNALRRLLTKTAPQHIVVSYSNADIHHPRPSTTPVAGENSAATQCRAGSSEQASSAGIHLRSVAPLWCPFSSSASSFDTCRVARLGETEVVLLQLWMQSHTSQK